MFSASTGRKGTYFTVNVIVPLEGTEAVTAHDVLEVFTTNAARIQKVVLEMVRRFPADLAALGAASSLAFTRGDGHAASAADIRIFETELGPGGGG